MELLRVRGGDGKRKRTKDWDEIWSERRERQVLGQKMKEK